MRNKTVLEELGTKISLLVEKYNREKEKNRILSEELSRLKNKLEEQKEKIIALKEDEELRDMEIDDISQKIGKLLT